MSNDVTEALRQYKDLEQLLCDLETYFDDRADAEYDTTRADALPNAEMKFLGQIRDILPRLPRIMSCGHE